VFVMSKSTVNDNNIYKRVEKIERENANLLSALIQCQNSLIKILKRDLDAADKS